MLDEVLLKTFSLFLRLVHIINSLVIVGVVGQFLSDVSGTEDPVPQAYVAVEAIACAAVLWSAFTLLFTCCAGSIILQVDIFFDILFAAAFIACIALLNSDAMGSCLQFREKYLPHWDLLRDCKLIKAGYAFSIINLCLFIVTTVTSIAIYLIRNRRHHHHHDKDHSHFQCHHECCTHTQDH
jgi:hypothetical protein